MRAGVANRIIAKGIDLILVILVAAFFPTVLGPILGFAYSLFADGMQFGSFKGQSVGKKIMNFQTVYVETQKPISYKTSLIRNSPIGIATFFSIIPFWGWIILVLVGFPLMAIEIYLMVLVESGHRLGDVMADTEVIQVKSPTQMD